MPELPGNITADQILSAILDIGIVAYIVYILLLLVRGTRTVPMALGLLFIVVVYVVSPYIGLTTTYMLLDQFMEVAVIFALIIFQDDIRRALVRMGRFARFTTAQESRVVEAVARAVERMAGRRIGALVVFERDADLAEFINEGTNLDAAVTAELLYSIFIPRMENPLHDGAAIIKNYRIREAGALLPLSINPRLDKNLGTRHRAGLGITEKTDAVTVVVSEERGTITLCFDGRMKKNLETGELRTLLFSLLSKEKSHERARDEQTGKVSLPENVEEGLVDEAGPSEDADDAQREKSAEDDPAAPDEKKNETGGEEG